MSTPKQQERRKRIEDAAYDALVLDGYRSASLLSIAQRASVSNETLYRWYGSKQALFRSLVERNAAEVRQQLENALEEDGPVLDLLARFGPVLLAMVTSERAVSLNRAAAADVCDTGTLGVALAEAGRGTIAPLLGDIFAVAGLRGEIVSSTPQEVADIYIRLLIGDLQIRRAIGALPELSATETAERAASALDMLLRLFDPTPGK